MADQLAVVSVSEEAEKIALIKSLVAKDCTNDELQLFLYTCKRTGLDPLARQIYAIKRGGKMSIQTGIDGYRVIADRTGKLAGISDPVHTEGEGAKYPLTASVTVKKVVEGGIIAEFTATARWGEYNAGGPMWSKMPYLMLGKCAEALALRKAFPADLSGVYTAEEMAQADNPVQDAVIAEVERQKALTTTLPISGVAIPPELDWSYNAKTGILICRIVSAVKRTKKTGGDYLTVEVNGKVGGKKPEVLTYFHEAHQAEILAAIGQTAKFEVEVKGDFANIMTVLELDGFKVETVDPDETKSRLMASVMDLQEEELREIFTHHCACNWTKVVAKLQDMQNSSELPELPGMELIP